MTDRTIGALGAALLAIFGLWALVQATWIVPAWVVEAGVVLGVFLVGMAAGRRTAPARQA